jgi:hypothetical protein
VRWKSSQLEGCDSHSEIVALGGTSPYGAVTQPLRLIFQIIR